MHGWMIPLKSCVILWLCVLCWYSPVRATLSVIFTAACVKLSAFFCVSFLSGWGVISAHLSLLPYCFFTLTSYLYTSFSQRSKEGVILQFYQCLVSILKPHHLDKLRRKQIDKLLLKQFRCLLLFVVWVFGRDSVSSPKLDVNDLDMLILSKKKRKKENGTTLWE